MEEQNINLEDNINQDQKNIFDYINMYNDILDKDDIFEIYDIIGICAIYIQAPNTEGVTQLFNKLKSKLVFKEYLSLYEKEIILRKALIDIRTIDNESYTLSSAYEVALVFDCLLAYTNIDPEIQKDWKDREFYDILLTSGLYDYIYNYCQKDYDRLMKMADRMLSWDNLKMLLKEISTTTPDNVDELTKAFKEFTENTDPEKLRLYGNILAGDDPLLNEIRNTVENNAYKAIKGIADKAKEN